jgi:glycosyltransferase involved in cell wall biosynthesis
MGAFKISKELKNIDIIHVNDFVGIFSGLLLKFIFKTNVVVHVRSLVNEDTRFFRTKMINFLLKKIPARVICIDGNVRRTISKSIDVDIIHNGLNIKSNGYFVPLKFESRVLKVGFVGNILIQKGILDLLEASLICKERGVPVEFHIYGDSAKNMSGFVKKILKYLNLQQNVKNEVMSYIEANDLSDIIHFHGFSDGLSEIYNNIDIVCFPSHLDAPGRPIFEAAYFCRPSIVAVTNPSPDTLVPGVTGITVPARSPKNLAEAIEKVAFDRDFLIKLGKGAKELSEKYYDQRKNSKRMCAIYRDIVGFG